MVPAVANSIISRAYSTPVGTIISLYGKTAPAGYLACDGATYNRDEYPDLAEYLVSQFEDLVGDGETTFKVPNLQGEFLRGTGTNSHANQGSGVNVGEHQNGTIIPHYQVNASALYMRKPSSANFSVREYDFTYAGTMNQQKIGATQEGAVSSTYGGTSRPTNTSVWYCIKI